MLTVYRKPSKVDENIEYEILINGCFMNKIKNDERVVITIQDKEKLNFNLSEEVILKMQVVSAKHKSEEIEFDIEDNQTVEFECIADYTEGPLGKIIDKALNKKGIKLEKTKDFFL